MRSFRSHNDPMRLRGVESGHMFWPSSPELAKAASNDVDGLAASNNAPSVATATRPSPMPASANLPTLDEAKLYLVHRFPTSMASILGEATRLATYTPRSILLVSPCFELLVASPGPFSHTEVILARILDQKVPCQTLSKMR
jgi:hypothetical protein